MRSLHQKEHASVTTNSHREGRSASQYHVGLQEKSEIQGSLKLQTSLTRSGQSHSVLGEDAISTLDASKTCQTTLSGLSLAQLALIPGTGEAKTVASSTFDVQEIRAVCYSHTGNKACVHCRLSAPRVGLVCLLIFWNPGD